MADILLTGGRGFIGTNLTEELKTRGHSVWTVDLGHGMGASDLRADVASQLQISRIFQKRDFDYVFHLAAEYGRWNGEDFYDTLWRTNVVGTKNILRLQERHRFRLIFFSSSEVYGDFDRVMTEDVMNTVPIKQMNDYAMTKWVGEMQCLNHSTPFDTETVRVRLGNLYGPHEYYSPYRGVIPVLAHKALQGERFVVYMGHKRSFGYIDDSVRALANIVDNFIPGEVYNIGGHEAWTITMEELAAKILAVTGANAGLAEYEQEEVQTTRVKIMDFSKARRDLGYEASIPLEDGLERYVRWLQLTSRVSEVTPNGQNLVH